jgi:hypothetical protein
MKKKKEEEKVIAETLLDSAYRLGRDGFPCPTYYFDDPTLDRDYKAEWLRGLRDREGQI